MKDRGQADAGADADGENAAADGGQPPAGQARRRRFPRNPFNIFGHGRRRRRAAALAPAQTTATTSAATDNADDSAKVVSHEDGACPPHGYRNMLAVLEALDLGATKYRDMPTDVRTDFRTLRKLDATKLPDPLSKRTLEEIDGLHFVWKVKTVKPIILSGPTTNAKKYRIPAGREFVLKRVSAFALQDFSTELDVYSSLQSKAAAEARTKPDNVFFHNHFVHVYGFFTARPSNRPPQFAKEAMEDGFFIMDAKGITDLEGALEASVKAKETAAVRLRLAGEVIHQVTHGVALLHAVSLARACWDGVRAALKASCRARIGWMDAPRHQAGQRAAKRPAQG
jgi:hypothetical protein